MRHIYRPEDPRRIYEDRQRTVREMIEWLATPSTGVVDRDEIERLKGCVLHLVRQRYSQPSAHMRYFRQMYGRDWPPGEDVAELREAYERRLDELAGSLPPELLAFARHVSLHDSEFRRFDVDEEDGIIEIEFETLEGDDSVEISLRYSGAAIIGGYTDSLVEAINAPHATVYDQEVDQVGEGVFEHRMLLIEGGDLAIRFSGFSYSRTLLDKRGEALSGNHPSGEG